MAEQYGFTVNQIKGNKIIYLNSDPVTSTMEGTNMMGAYVKDGVFYYDGVPLMRPTDNNYKAGVYGGNKTFGDIALDTATKECINITIDNYNKLLANEMVPGYKPYNRYDVYNLVEDPANTDPIYYTEEEGGYRFGDILWKEKEDVIYNNVVGIELNTPYEVDFAANVSNIDPPYIDLRYFSPIIEDNSSITLQYRVTDLKDSVLNYDTIGPHIDRKGNTDQGIYRFILRTEDGQTVEKTTYSGTIWIDTPVFSIGNKATEENGDRRTWFSIECIDSRGVASIRQYLDVYIKASSQERILEVDDAYLSSHGVAIGEDGNNEIAAYKNKKALSDIFAAAKDANYTGIKFCTAKPRRYYISYQKRINNSTAENPVLGVPTYYLATISDANTISEYTEIDFDHVLNDKSKLFRYDNDTICYVGDEAWYALSSDERERRKNNGEYLRTHKLRHHGIDYYKTHKLADPNIPKTSRETITDKYNGRTLYIVINPTKSNSIDADTTTAQYRNGDNLLFPDHFTVDLNGSEIKAHYSYYVDSGCIVRFKSNIDSHIKNGKITGLYGHEFNFLHCHLATAHDIVGEASGLLVIWTSNFCTVDNMEISGSLGYECVYMGGGLQGGLSFDFHNGYYLNSDGSMTQSIEGVELEDGIGITTATIQEDKTFTLDSRYPYKAIGRSGYAGYNCTGKRHEIFLAFYTADDVFIDMIKTKLYHPVRVPSNARKLKFMGYGTWITSLEPYTASNWVRSLGSGGIFGMTPVLPTGCAITNCTIHDTRSTALTNPQGRQLLYDNLTLYKCATTEHLGTSSGGSITPLLGDFEDSWQWAKHICVRNCEHISYSGQSSSKMLLAYCCESMTYVNNKNISLKLGGNVESGLFADNSIPGFVMTKSRGCFHPFLEIKNNYIGRFTASATNYESVMLTIQEQSDGDTTVEDVPVGDSEEGNEEVEIDITEIDTEYNDLMEKIIPISYSTFKLPINYGYFKLRKCLMDINGFDYIY